MRKPRIQGFTATVPPVVPRAGRHAGSHLRGVFFFDVRRTLSDNPGAFSGEWETDIKRIGTQRRVGPGRLGDAPVAFG